MIGYTAVGEFSEHTIDQLAAIASQAVWSEVLSPDRHFMTWYAPEDDIRAIGELADRWPCKWHSCLFLKLPPGGRVHRHADVLHPWRTYHVPITSNSQCASIMFEAELEHSYWLEVGSIYLTERTREHRSVNRGRSDRIHLMMEVYDEN